MLARFVRIAGFCCTEGIPRRSASVMLVVGTILNLINQGDALLGSGRINIAKLLLTYAVPYCVATYGAVSYRYRAAAADTRPVP